MIGYYIPEIRSKKWYRSIVSHLLQICMYNSYILYTKVTNSQKDFLFYQESIIKQLISPMRERKSILATKEKKFVTKNNRLESTGMIIECGPEDCTLRKNTLKECVICCKRKSSYCCSLHNKPTCIIPCYDLHRKNVEL